MTTPPEVKENRGPSQRRGEMAGKNKKDQEKSSEGKDREKQ